MIDLTDQRPMSQVWAYNSFKMWLKHVNDEYEHAFARMIVAKSIHDLGGLAASW